MFIMVKFAMAWLLYEWNLGLLKVANKTTSFCLNIGKRTKVLLV